MIRAAAILLCCQIAWAGGAIRLKSRTIDPGREDRASADGAGGRYLMVRFAAEPGPEVRWELALRGFRILSYVPEATLMLEAPSGGGDLWGLGVVWAGAMNGADKISPLLAGQADGLVLVEFHPGVEGQTARAIAAQHGFAVHEIAGLLPGHLVLGGDRRGLADLAGHPEVAYILPAAPGLAGRRAVYGCPGPITGAGPVADYALADNGWSKDASGNVALQYVFDSLTQKMDAGIARAQVERAFTEWARYANISFTPAVASAARTIEIQFVTGAHGDAYPFTSITTLAHTFYPAPVNPEPIAGDVHFNDAETWGVGMNIDLFSVALHEIGHALGLGHSDQPSAVMYPYYKLSTGLTADDIAAIQALYGPPSSGSTTHSSPPATPTPTPSAPPSTPSTPSTPTPSGSDTTAPTIVIQSPSYSIVSTSNASITVSGTASDNLAVASVKWSTSFGSTGIAVGTTSWSATIPLLIGTNTITLRAYDAAGNSGWRALTVVRN